MDLIRLLLLKRRGLWEERLCELHGWRERGERGGEGGFLVVLGTRGELWAGNGNRRVCGGHREGDKAAEGGCVLMSESRAVQSSAVNGAGFSGFAAPNPDAEREGARLQARMCKVRKAEGGGRRARGGRRPACARDERRASMRGEQSLAEDDAAGGGECRGLVEGERGGARGCRTG